MTTDDFADPSPKRIPTSQASSSAAFWATAGPKPPWAPQQVECVRDREQAFRMLLAGRFDVFVEVEDLAKPSLKAIGLDDDIKAIPLVLAMDDVKVCIGKRSPLVGRMREIDETIRAMRKDGTMARLRKP